MGSYNKRAVLVRILNDYPHSDNKGRHSELQSQRIQQVKYFTKETCCNEVPCYNWTNDEFTDMNALYEYVCYHVEAFELSEIPKTECWDGIVSIIEQLEFKYETRENEYGKYTQIWSSKPLESDEELEKRFNNMSEDQEDYITSLGTALECDMKNGQAKQWINTLIQTLIKTDNDLSLKDLRCLNPSLHCNTNTVVEIIIGDLGNPITRMLFDAPYTCDSNTPDVLSSSLESLSSSESLSKENKTIKRHTVVPDFCAVKKGFPGWFPFVVEFQPAGQETQGYNQNILQMLSKMFFQKVIFGLVVSSRAFRASIIIKSQGVIHCASSTHSLTTFKDGSSILDLEAINNLCTFIYRVLKWSKT